MSTVQFLPWLRTGLATMLDAATSTDGSLWFSPTVDVIAEDGPHAVEGPQIRLRGPGDVIALGATAIKRHDPEAGAAEAETNYFCSVEFYAPDLPWRYSPLLPDGDVLAPWIALVVVELGDDVTISTPNGRLPVLHVEDPAADLPDLADSWAWAHVQAATDLDGGVPAAYDADPAAFTSRLLCPRRLRAGTSYIACLVPTFHAGRIAGLGLGSSTSTDPAWGVGPVDLPVYGSWELTAGDRVDFKQLAMRIEPGELPPDVGFRDLDLTDMGTGMTPLHSRATFAGAMHAPSDGLVYWHAEDDRDQFETDVRARLVVTPPRRSSAGRYDPLRDDPVVAPPAYGAPQIGTNAVPNTDRPGPGTGVRIPLPGSTRGWFEQLNVAPHHRAVAALGTEVVRHDQEALMAAAWEQAQEAIRVNRTLNRGRLVEETARAGERKWNTLGDAVAVSIAAPAFVSMRTSDGSLVGRLDEAGVPSAYFGSTFRRLGRNGGPLATRARLQAAQSPAITIARTLVESGREPDSATTDPLSVAYRTRYLPAGMDVGGPVAAEPTGGPFDTAMFDRFDVFDRTERVELRGRARDVAVIGPGAAVDADKLAGRPDLGAVVVDAEGPFLNEGEVIDLPNFTYAIDRPVIDGRIVTTSTERAPLGFDLAGEVREKVTPEAAVIAATASRVSVPADLWSGSTPIPTRVGLQPRFTDPMYERVRALSVDFLIPGVGAVPNNTVALLEVNPAYIDAFLVGLNHEMSRELRWREYPADLRQTWFQRFFDSVDPPGSVDIRPIAEWGRTQRLGDEYAGGGTGGEPESAGLVLLIKADLIRKFPDVRVYAVPAMIDAEGERVPNVGDQLESPSFVGSLGRGINFYGFDGLTEEQARGDGAEDGWFFVLEEEPRATRFGLDIGGTAGQLPDGWNSLGWRHLAAAGERAPWFCSIDPPNVRFDGETTLGGLTWGDDAAAMAAITFRRPIQIFMHATAMLPGGRDGRT